VFWRFGIFDGFKCSGVLVLEQVFVQRRRNAPQSSLWNPFRLWTTYEIHMDALDTHVVLKRKICPRVHFFLMANQKKTCMLLRQLAIVAALAILLLFHRRHRRRPQAKPILERMRQLSFALADGLKDRRTRETLRRRLKHTVFTETEEGDPAFGRSIDKGKTIQLCVLSSSGEPEQDVYIVHALVHELAHVASDSVGHTKEFHTNLDALTYVARRRRVLPETLPPAIHCGAFL
jgi:hypothetical protein